MIQHLRQRQMERLWTDGDVTEGVVLKRAKNDFICQPPELQQQVFGCYDEIRRLNVKVAMTVKTAVIQTFLKEYNLPFVPLNNGLQLQVLPSIVGLSRCKKHHYAAFIKDMGMLVVWEDDPSDIIRRVETIEDLLVQMLWTLEDSKQDLEEVFEKEMLNYSGTHTPVNVEAKEVSAYASDEELATEKPRPTMLYQAFLVAIACTLVVFTLSIGWRRLAIECRIDQNYTRLVLFACTPFQIWIGWFFFQSLVSGVAQIIGPVKHTTQNSKSYSGVAPRRICAPLPHVTIQCPVYKEGLQAVIQPTIVSIKKAISTYEMQGGSANIFINDDGMQLVPQEEAEARRSYYEDNNIGWVARPKHQPKGDADGKNISVRAGKFKKASNMNYALNVSTRIEDMMRPINREACWNQDDEDALYQQCLAQILEEDEGRTWADGDLRIGEYILIIDSDTRVPEDCFLDAVSEMEQSPSVAIIQFSSGVMNVTTSFFEQGITFFTNLIYTAIRFGVSNGDVAPFVGHNAVLRWSAVQDVSFTLPGTTTEKYWAENTVSEDFDMALRLQSLGYVLRFSTVFADGFKEGVSLTVYDELARWEKYAYGCSELLFNPFKYWFTRGPLTPLFRRFIWSNMSWMGKITIMSYIGTYFALGAAWPLTVANYFLIGWFNGHLDQYYVDSFKIYFGIIIVFQALGTVSLAVVRYRTEARGLVASLLENFKWLLLLTTFLGGVSMHVSQAIVCHLCSIDMSWGATAKEATTTSFFKEIPTILRKFKFTFMFCIGASTTMIVLSGVGPVGQLVPYHWQITGFTAQFPLAILVVFHFFMPLVLNPGLMQFTF
ncbi:hypothetical protein LTR24_010057 [Lithohypha guttulata]|uniref:Glycosyltransferase 2-like domain-containing protein n=1 Tax=Lithohypha guttulata TaxID=1690604 RepID=A0ABR0JV45_9EURO|nr:hypothetical protein LTR24_010057 [Lithohypha guttulata]